MASANDITAIDRHAGISAAMPRDYFELLKPRVMSLVVFTAIAGLLIAPGDLHPVLAFIAILCIAIGAGAAGALNMWYDADIDARMARTAGRPVATGRISPGEALSFGLVLAFFSVFTLGVLVDWLAAGLLAFTIFFYAVIYTIWLKRATPQNIVIGGAAGAFPPMIGWASVTGAVSLESVVLFAIIFIWTPPHFWALALFKSGDYDRVGIPMLPNVAGNRATQNQIFFYSLALAPVGVLPYLMGFAGMLYGIAAAGLGIVFTVYAYRCWRMPSDDRRMIPAKKLFGFSIVYLFGIFAMLMVDWAVAPFLAPHIPS